MLLSIPFCLALAVLALQTAQAGGHTTSLRGQGVEPHHLDGYADKLIVCRITMFGTMYVTKEDGIVTEEKTTCIPIVDGIETDLDFPIELPADLAAQYAEKIKMGKLLVSISGAELVDEKLVMGDKPQFKVVTDRRLLHLQERHLQNEGTVTIAVIRISTSDSIPKASAADLRNIFSNGVDFRAQYDACSFGKLKFQLADAGVIDVQVPQAVSTFASSTDLITAAQTLLKTQLQVSEISSLATKVIMCLPSGTGDWAASAGVNHWRAQFNNDWCTSLSGNMHEIGHTLGLLHSNADGVMYADRSGYMGSGYTDAAWPRKCFNGYNSWYFGWYSTRHLSFNPAAANGDQLIKLATFVDFDKAATDEYVVVNLNDQYYLQYNMAKGFNIDTEQKQNQVTITESLPSGTDSRAGLSAGNEFRIANFNGSTKTLVVTACKTLVGTGGSDIMEISVAMDKSLCGTGGTGTGGRSDFLTLLNTILSKLKAKYG